MKNRSEFLKLASAYMDMYKPEELNEQSVNPNQFQSPTGGANPNQFQAPVAPFTGTVNNTNTTNQQTNATALPQQQGTSEADRMAKELFRAQYSKFKELSELKDPNAFVDSVRKMFPNEPNVVKQVENMVKSEPGNLQNIINSINKMVGMETSSQGQAATAPFSQGTIE